MKEVKRAGWHKAEWRRALSADAAQYGCRHAPSGLGSISQDCTACTLRTGFCFTHLAAGRRRTRKHDPADHMLISMQQNSKGQHP